MAAPLAILRSQVETALAGRVVAPFTYRDRKIVDSAAIGIPDIDLLAGGFPRGGLTEICGPACSGRTTLLISALAERTAHEEVCALVDARDAFDPHSAGAAGVRLDQLLWIRCHNIDQAFRATDLLIQGGGFGLIALDLSDIPPQTVRYVPLNAWFRFQRAVEDTATTLVVLDQEPNAKTCASLVLQVGSEPAIWSSNCEVGPAVPDSFTHSNACLLNSLAIRTELLRSRMQARKPHLNLKKTGTSNEIFSSAAGQEIFSSASPFAASSLPENSSPAASARFQTRAVWSYGNGVPAALKH